ncbi:hypothetical protein ET495_06785 [Xylanimonas allomyrinae]|uniref:Uncharacterized protein n=1 Tax=Xylanimonas allomyrinae TaxID=2509459 RepID=A0A4P6EL90_9MICO|nr:hypothetical protein [Xylanimonas allomyrinae]QAY62996.1 hypothetical protein ET495_06785 [Xylanimonas allomyrinae]
MSTTYRRRLIAAGTCVTLALAIGACSSANERKYDIAPIFPLSADKCEKYNGETEGEGRMAHCWVSLDDCRRAAVDWAAAMKKSGVDDAILFSCE